MRFLACILVLLTGVSGALAAADRAELQALLAEAADGNTAAVLHVITQDESFTLTHGRKWRGGPAVEADDLFVLASVSKPYLAAAVLSLSAEGRLPLDRPIGKFLRVDTLRGFAGVGRITVRMLLAMRSGLADYYTGDYLDEVILPRRGAVYLNRALDYARGESLGLRPGLAFDYSNTNYLLAQAALERASGRRMHEVFRDRLFRKAGLNRSFVLNALGSPPPSVAGYEDLHGDGPEDMRSMYHAPGFGDGGLVASAADTGRFFHALLIEKLLLPPMQLAAMLADPEKDEYGLGIDVSHDAKLGVIFGHSGGDLGYVSDVRIVPSKGIVVVSLFGSVEADSDVTWRVLKSLSE